MADRPERVFGREDYTNDFELQCDALVIGSGAGGGVVAAELAEAGLDVIILEEGSYHDTSEFTPEASLMIRKMYRDGGAAMTMGMPSVIFSEGRTVGGSTVINGGMSWRTPENILDGWARNDQVDKITMKDMDRHFARVEKYISAKYQDPESKSQDNEILIRGADAKGWRWIKNIRNQNHCAGCNNCAWGCPHKAKRSVLVTYVPRALAFGARIYSDCRAATLIRKGTRVTGVNARAVNANGTDGCRITVHATITVAACGAMQTPSLLMRSGIKGASKRLGRDLWLHPNTKVQAIFDEMVEGWKGVHQAYQVREFRDAGFLFAAVNIPPGILAMTMPHFGEPLRAMMQEYDHIVNAGLLLEDSHPGHLTNYLGRPFAFYEFDDNDAKRAVNATMLLCELLFAAGAKKIAAPFDGAPDLHTPDDIKKMREWKVPRKAIELFTVHLMGTARMGGDPARHVCDSYGKVHGWEGLWVSDASLFPGPIGVNPMETIMALATRNAERLIEDHFSNRL
jgi:choline dehydrogenase-like flavoprotein